MFGLRDVSIDFLTGAPVLVTLGLAGLLALAWFLYYRTNPPLPRYLRVMLAVIRVVAILALMTALLEPVIKYGREFERKRRVDLLIDNSASMDRVETGLSRRARLDSLLSTASFAHLKGAVDLSTWFFGQNLTPNQSDVERDKTALGDVLVTLGTAQLAEPADQLLLFSDGRSNSGREPSEATAGLRAPVISINMAGDGGNYDIALADVEFNPVLFVGQPTEIKTRFTWQNAAGRMLKIQLLKGERVLSEGSFNTAEEGGTGEATLKWVPDAPGQELLKVSIPPLQGEEIEANNTRTIAVKVLKSKLLVLLVADHPDHEVGFLKRFLEQSDRFDVDLKVTGPRAGNLSGRFPSQQTELNRYDLVLLYDPDPVEFEARQMLLKAYLSERGGAVWVLLGEQFANRGPVPWFNQLLPFFQSARRQVERFQFHGEPSEGNLFHPSVRLADDRAAIREVWSTVPPFQSLVRCDTVDPHAVILAYAAEPVRATFKSPILGFKRFGPGKLLASAALPFWTWGFADVGAGGSGLPYGSFLDGTARWLTVRDDFDPIRILPEKEVFTRGEPVRFNGFAYDQGFRPITGVIGSLRLQSSVSNQSFDADLLELGEGRYEASFGTVPPGQYKYLAAMSKDGQELRRAEGQIQVESFSLEEFDQSGFPATLQALSKLTGGAYFPVREFDEAIAHIDTRPVMETVRREIVLWNKFWLLALFVTCLAVEWVLRKTNQLI
ncbi:MAG: hypothetical protein AB1644_13390 [Candidatus Zixiibacteriota bacterium]